VTLLQRSFVFLLLICLGCSAQSAPSDTTKAIERQVRAYYKLPPEVQVIVGPLKPSEFPGYDALKLTFNRGTKKDEYDFLLSRDSKTLIRMTKMDLTKDPNAEIMKKLDLKGRPTKGNKDAKVVVVNYDDFECPFCSRMHQTIHAAVDANCLAAQNNDAYWDLADYLHASQHVINSNKAQDAQFDAVDRATLLAGQQHNVDVVKLHACIKAQNEDAVKASIHEGDALGVQATPTLFVNGEEMDGALPLSEVRAVLDRALTNAGAQPPTHADAAPAPLVINPPSK
jgi:protein-disulfide isomerase